MLTLQTCAELADGEQQVEIVAADIVLGHVDDRACKADLLLLTD